MLCLLQYERRNRNRCSFLIELNVDGLGRLQVQQAFCETLRYTTKEGPKAVCYWPARFTGIGDVRLSHEHQQYTWVALKEAMELVQYPEMAALLSAAQRFLAAQ